MLCRRLAVIQAYRLYDIDALLTDYCFILLFVFYFMFLISANKRFHSFIHSFIHIGLLKFWHYTTPCWPTALCAYSLCSSKLVC